MSHFGAHQFAPPKSLIIAGTKKPLIRVASSKIATAIPRPSIFMIETPLEANAPNVTAKISAAAVMILPERCSPRATEFTVLKPASCYSLMRLRRKSS